MIRIAIAEDNTFLQKAIIEKISFYEDLACRFTALNGKELLEKLEANPNIDLIIMDIEMPKMNGIEATFAVKSRYPHIKIIMLTIFDNDERIFDSIKAGADGYLLKEVKSGELHKGILETMEGGAAMTPSIALKTLKLLRNPIENRNPAPANDVCLTSRETEVLEQLSKGLNYNQIATNLFISTGTVRKHIENIYSKLQVHNKMEAVEKARHNNII
ncbi:response regulator transcription factor [Flavobacterium sp. MFBS3-15]|uniref:response regulator n=1 Tax=Flavobacterium sp. MFBS3-15 TaxID=2989816 RepID=UPI002236B624|nr:response regulator transcription factor [Flavobacterium sp. MFBS3-15]MCW4469518.1 response regulator transcription factor [Flavobacterium sp. MFBS3-15]